MTNPTTPFNWQMPTSTDLVTDLPADFETFGQAVATSMADLLGGTTGQVLSKASNTDMDFTWVAQDDSNAIQNAIVDAKGDLIGATAADTPARLAVGTNGQVLTADSTAATGLKWATPSGGTNLFYAGKNKFINGKFDVWQRGTSISVPNASWTYGPDRFAAYSAFSAGTSTFSQQTFTPGAAPVSGYEGSFFARLTCGSTATFFQIEQRIEDVRTFAGQTVTVSFWAKSSATPTVSITTYQNFGTGGSSGVNTDGTSFALTSSWVRYSATLSIPSISGKTIGTNSAFNVGLVHISGGINSATIDTWGWQIEAGSTATDFQTASGSIQGELDICRRYYQRLTSDTNGVLVNYAFCSNSTLAIGQYQYVVPMRTVPTSLDFSSVRFRNHAGSAFNMSSILFNEASAFAAQIYGTISGGTAEQPGSLLASATPGFIGLSAEL